MKERLTGAIILVALIVLLVPELLSGPKGPAPNGPTATSPAPGAAPTSSEEPPLRSYTINLGDDAHARTEAAGSNGPAMPQPTGSEQPGVSPNPAQPGAGPSSSGSPEQSSTAAQSAEHRDGSQASSTPASGATQSGGEQPANPSAQAPSNPQAAHGTTSQPHNTPGDSPTQHPAARSASSAAPVAKATAPRSASPNRTVAADKPAPAAANSTAAPESGGWAVQLGVFASKENAERLALDVRVKGFKVSVSPITSGGRKLYRVRVGPTPDRSAAQELQGRLKALGRPGGAVVPYS